MSHPEIPDRDWRPTQTSTAIAVATAVLVVGAMLWEVEGVLVPTLIGVGGAALFTLSCWLLSTDDDTLTSMVVSLLTVPVALGLLASCGVVALVRSGALFPVANGSLVSVATLIVLGHVGVVFGCVVAVLGFAVGYWNVLDSETLARYSKVAFASGAGPALVSTVLVVSASAFEHDLSWVTDVAVSTVVSVAIAPEPTGLNLAGFLLVVTVAAASLRLAVAVLPVAELLAVSETGERRDLRVRRLRTGLTRLAIGAGVLHAIALALEISTSAESLFGPGLYGLIQGIATARILRLVFVGTAVLALLAVATSLTVRRIAQETREGTNDTAGPVLGGLLVTFVALVVAEPVYDGTVERVAGPMPPSVASNIRETSALVADAYGEETIVVLLSLALVTVTLLVVVALRFALFVGYLSRESGGYSLASGGLFTATVFAGTLDAPLWLVFGGVLGSLLVWDTGRFATTLGREIGRTADTRSTELTHAAGTVAVGLLGAVVAVGVANVVGGGVAGGSSTTPVALLAVVAGILCLVAALR